mgnify:CR=1 FL=1
MLTAPMKAALAANTVDYAILGSMPTAADQSAMGDLVAYPFFAQALVPVFRIDGVDPNARVIATPDVLARMYLGNVSKPRYRSAFACCAC